MTLTLTSAPLGGSVRAHSSKSVLHRLLVAAALGSSPVCIAYNGAGQDIEATLRCLSALGAGICRGQDTVTVTPIQQPPAAAELPCGESGSTLRFLLPVAAALGVQARFTMQGRLPQRPIEPLLRALQENGACVRQQDDALLLSGALRAGNFCVPGNISSQFITGLLFALPLLAGRSTLTVTGELQSGGYVALTESILRQAGVRFEKKENSWHIAAAQRYALPAAVTAEGDWSNAAVWLCMGALQEEGITVTGLPPLTLQGDSAVVQILRRFGADVRQDETGVTVRRGVLRACEIDAADIPDLVPLLAVVACAAEGQTHIIRAGRLRLKESDRLASTAALIHALGGSVQQTQDGLVITGSALRYPLAGGEVSAAGDHRIAMAAAAAALLSRGAVQLEGAQSVEKSYPGFWSDRASLIKQ